jgi:hypothetical protein
VMSDDDDDDDDTCERLYGLTLGTALCSKTGDEAERVVWREHTLSKVQFDENRDFNVAHSVVIITILYQQKISQTQHQYCIKIYVRGGYMFRPFKRPSSGHPLNNNSIKSKTHEMLAHYGIRCGFTRLVMDKSWFYLFLSITNLVEPHGIPQCASIS